MAVFSFLCHTRSRATYVIRTKYRLSKPSPHIILQVLDLSPERESCLSCNMVSIPTAIGQLTNLRVLMLDTNELADLPVELSQLSNLERLSLSNNHLSSLPPGFERLQKMRSLHAANNAFDQFPESLCQFPELEFLDLSDNKLAALPESISNLSNLQVCTWVRLGKLGWRACLAYMHKQVLCTFGSVCFILYAIVSVWR